jgi:RHS repeat-associated protein
VIDWTYHVTNVTYDSYGRVEKYVYPSGFAVEHEYNPDGYLRELSESGSGDSIWVKSLAEPDGQPRSVTLGNGVSSSRFYTAETGRVRTLLDRSSSGSSPWIQRTQVTFDYLGNLTQHGDFDTGILKTMDYDALNRLTDVDYSDGAPSNTFAYDELGNLISKTGVGTYTYAAGAGTHAVTQVDPEAGGAPRYYRYDLNGNMTCRGSSVAAICNGGTDIRYSWFNKPMLIETPSGAQSEFLYDADHARIRQVTTANGTTTTTRYVGSTYEKVTRAGVTEQVHHVFAEGVAVAQYIDHEGATPDEWRYLHRDHIGSVVATSDGNGALVQRMDFDPHGKRTAENASAQAESPELARGFTGHEHLEDVGLIHMNGRVYDPELGRMLSVDPFIVNPLDLQTYNRYAYVLNNPMSLTDPSGYAIPSANTNLIASYNETESRDLADHSSAKTPPPKSESNLVKNLNKTSRSGQEVHLEMRNGTTIIAGGNATFTDAGNGKIDCFGCKTIRTGSRISAARGSSPRTGSRGIGTRKRGVVTQTGPESSQNGEGVPVAGGNDLTDRQALQQARDRAAGPGDLFESLRGYGDGRAIQRAEADTLAEVSRIRAETMRTNGGDYPDSDQWVWRMFRFRTQPATGQTAFVEAFVTRPIPVVPGTTTPMVPRPSLLLPGGRRFDFMDFRGPHQTFRVSR